MVAPFLGFPRIVERAPQDPKHPVHPGWPECTPTVTLRSGERIRLRPLMKSDGNRWRDLRLRNQPFLQPVEPTVPGTWEEAHTTAAWHRMFSYLHRAARSGMVVPFVIELDGIFVGQLTLGNIQRGVGQECWVGYWVDHESTGRGVAKTSTALAVDFAFRRIGLHRVTATYLPTNPASGAVLSAVGFQEEGLLRRNLHIDGAWQDHYMMSLVADDFEYGAVDRLQFVGLITQN